MPIVEPLSVASLDYLRSFSLKCIAFSPSGRIFTCNNPAGMAGAWWAKADDADRIAAAAWLTGGDVPSAAAKLGLVATPHCVVVKRVAERVSVIDQTIAQAIDAGVLKSFNSTYRARRLQAMQRGKSFMSYSQALAKLRKVVADAVAKDGTIPKSFVDAVFDEARPSP